MTNETNKKDIAIQTKKEAIARIMQIMDEISAEAERRGLTPEILESLLK
ncbi:hypothetical protein DSM106972_019990 [Dulcicalothrix desertica PCC 7102]|uniref:Uncharacterized protein n=1 Tax=Dulcicalothrix desertica PCC 7102 TaxID=232991 RepID=A0A3S1B9V6_9CYAN|nr:hypothetical protein [Dulcicalothrix desertica]RUT07739.1 hypothetical protein DSM106972_019990 [Dulcicalothrix desertica PCC 7102]TWH39273.1 hypothetical protein CAL7102_08492 [Dulcicalothrix desertica PCC 7102]